MAKRLKKYVGCEHTSPLYQQIVKETRQGYRFVADEALGKIIRIRHEKN